MYTYVCYINSTLVCTIMMHCKPKSSKLPNRSFKQTSLVHSTILTAGKIFKTSFQYLYSLPNVLHYPLLVDILLNFLCACVNRMDDPIWHRSTLSFWYVKTLRVCQCLKMKVYVHFSLLPSAAISASVTLRFMDSLRRTFPFLISLTMLSTIFRSSFTIPHLLDNFCVAEKNKVNHSIYASFNTTLFEKNTLWVTIYVYITTWSC